MRFAFNFGIIVVGLLIFGLTCSNTGYSQNNSKDKKALEQQRKGLEKQIGVTKKLIDQTSTKKSKTINQLSLLQKQVNERKQLIQVYGSELQQIEQQMVQTRQQIADEQAKMKLLKKEYSDLIYQSYKARSHTDQWMFIFASEDFYQAMRRVQYLKEYNMYRRKKADEIAKLQLSLQDQMLQLENQKAQRLGLMTQKEAEAKKLERDSEQTRKTISQLQGQEKELRGQLKQQQQEYSKLNREIQRLIEAEVKKTTKKNESGKTLPASPAEMQLNKDFTSNKGRLPWPVKSATIVSEFGLRNHPELHLMIDNKGIDFQTEKGAQALAVFEGIVVKVIQLPRYKAVLVRHGNYYTVYDRLSQVFVTTDQKINTRQAIGVIWTDPDTDETILHFELRNQVEPQNPHGWILRR